MNTFWDDIKVIISRPAVTLVILILISLGICGLYANEKENGPLHIFQNACSTISLPVSNFGQMLNGGLSSVEDYIFNSIASDQDIQGLKQENAKLRSQLAAAENYKEEAERLQDILNLKNQYKTEGIVSRVIGLSPSAWNQTITISSGIDDGISAGQTVLGRNGVVGQIDSATPNSSTVRLLTDPNSGVAVKIMSDSNDCILRGSLDGVLYLEGLDAGVNVSVGDVVTTSGLGGSYVQGLVIGRVSQIISSQSGTNRKIIVSSIEQNSKLSEVFVIRESE